LRLLTGVVCCLLCRDVERSWCSHRSPLRTAHHGTNPPGSPPHWPPWSVCGDRRGRGRAPARPGPGQHTGGEEITVEGDVWGREGGSLRARREVDVVAMTAMVKDELSRVECTKTSERKAEVTALLRFSGGLHIVGGGG